MSKPPAQREIDRPLGLDQGLRREGRHRGSLPWDTIATAVAGVAIFSASGFIALQDEPFRRPATVVVSTPEAVPAEPQVAAQTAEPASSGYPDDDAKASGPSIINVAPPREDAGSVVVIRDPSALGQDLRVAHLPDPALIEESEYGPLPTRSEDGRRPFDVYARPWSGARGARVAIVIGGLGVSQTGTQAAIAQLPSEVTLAFASGGNSLDRWMRTARQEGHEIVMQLPLEPFDYPQVDPGRNTLTVDAAPEENRDRLYWALSRITNYTGVMNYMGARFVGSDAAMDPLFGELAERGLMYVDDGSTQRSTAEEMAKRKSVPFAAADTIIDAERERGAILKKLDEIERIARAKGFAVATGSAFDVTVEAVSSWVAEARSRGIEIVPISAVAADPEKD